MIPKIIHYIWLGGKPLTPLATKCLESWKKYCPDYEIKLWNEDNFDITKNKYCKQAYDAKKWAFASDYVRVSVLKEYGGIYFDTDLELIKPIDNLLQNTAFSGMEDDRFIATGFMGCEKNSEWITKIYDLYNDISFIKEDGSYDLTPNPRKATQMALEMYPEFKDANKLEIISYPKLTIYPPEYFYPLDYKTKKIVITNKTLSIHHYEASWIPKSTKMKMAIKKFIKKVIFYDKWRKRK